MRFARWIVSDEGNKLASVKVELGQFQDAEFKVVTLGRFGQAYLAIE